MAAEQFDLESSNSIYMNCYTGPEVPGFTGIIKRHSEDFVVTEIDSVGQLVALTSREVPPLPSTQLGRVKQIKPRPLASSIPPLDDLIGQEQLTALQMLATDYRTSGLIGEEVKLGCYEDKEIRGQIHIAVRSKFPVLMTKTDKGPLGVSMVTVLPDPKFLQLSSVMTGEDSEQLLLFVNTADRAETHLLSSHYSRDTRRQIHHLLHEVFGALLITHTLTSQEKKSKLSKNTRILTSGGPSQIAVRFRTKRQTLSEEVQTVTKFVLRKKNIETLAAIDLLSEVLGCQPSQFACSGVKDKKAVTTQHMTVTNVSAEQLSAANEHSELKGYLELGNYHYVPNSLKTGEHSGNHFTIAIRDAGPSLVDCLEERVAMAIKSVQERGFVNYFGPQRFGGGATSPRIALAMLKREYKKAVNLILTSSSAEQGEAAEARDYYQSTGDVVGTLERMPQYKTRERYVLRALHRHGNGEYGCVCALNSVPHSWRRLYLHGLSSLVWNHLASTRVREYGLQAVEGDLIIREDGNKESVGVLSAGEVSSYSISDVVLPCVGTGSVLPSNKVGVCLTEILTTLGISLASFRMPRLGLTTTGAYRKLIAYPKQLSWRWLEPLVVDTAVADSTHGVTVGVATNKDREEVGVTTSEGRGVEVSFSLDKSCYATVLLRELMKTDI